MSKFFLIFLSFTLINTMTIFSSRNMQDQPVDTEVEVVEEDIEDEETTTSKEEEETPEEETSDDTESTSESKIDDQTPEEETEVSEKEDNEDDSEILPDMDIELTDEEKALVFKYIGKIDVEYLLSLSSDGISEDENILIIKHLKERLTEEEYKEVEGLIIRFLYSLE